MRRCTGYRLSREGFTLIELLIILAVAGVLLAATGTFLINNLRSFNMAGEQITVQDQAQRAMNHIVEEIMPAKGINSIVADDGGYYTVSFLSTSGKLIFYRYHSSSKALYHGYGTEAWEANALIASGISEFRIEPEGSRGAVIYISSRLNDEEARLENRVYFRNQ